MKKYLSDVVVVCCYTFKEVWQSKIFINIAVLGLLILGVSYIASEFTYLSANRVALDFGLGLASLAATGLSIFWGVGLIASEIENRTLYLILTRPIDRKGFILGKILGMLGVLFTQVVLIYLLSISIYFFMGGQYNSLIGWALAFTFLEAMIVLLIATTLSIIMNKALATFNTLILFVLGHAISGSINTDFVISRPILQKFIKSYSVIFPDFTKLNIKPFLIYQKSLDLSYLTSSICYGLFYALGLTTLTILIFGRKELE